MIVMQLAQYAANNFPFLSRRLHNIKAFSIKNATNAQLLDTFLRISGPKTEIFDKFNSA